MGPRKRIARSRSRRKKSGAGRGEGGELETRLGYTFRDATLLALALTHASSTVKAFTDNERVEFLGDAVVALAVIEHLYRTFTRCDEGEMTRIKSVVVSTTILARRTRGLRLQEHLVLGKGLGSPSRLPDSVCANVFEAVTGAIYLDGGYEPARDFVLRELLPEIDAVSTVPNEQNYKSIFQEYAQRLLGRAPRYEVMRESGPDHGKTFVVRAVVAGRAFPPARGRTKKTAEQRAAYAAWQEAQAGEAAREEAKVIVPEAPETKAPEAKPKKKKTRRGGRKRTARKRAKVTAAALEPEAKPKEKKKKKTRRGGRKRTARKRAKAASGAAAPKTEAKPKKKKTRRGGRKRTARKRAKAAAGAASAG